MEGKKLRKRGKEAKFQKSQKIKNVKDFCKHKNDHYNMNLLAPVAKSVKPTMYFTPYPCLT